MSSSDSKSDCSEYSYDDDRVELGPDNGQWPFGGQGGPQDVPVVSGAGCVKISKIMARAKDQDVSGCTFGGPADMLPPIPGLFVETVGDISTPLTDDRAPKLIARCEKSTDGSFDRQIDPKFVQFKNPMWQSGLDKLRDSIAERLGCRRVPIQCFAEVAGDLVIYREDGAKFSHEFGKGNDMTKYNPHYAGYYADAEYELEKVTKGYRLILVYSLCLPPALLHLKRDHTKRLSDELASVINELRPEEGSFALLLTHKCTKHAVEASGSHVLQGTDLARFRLLEANNAVPADKKLLLFIVNLSSLVVS